MKKILFLLALIVSVNVKAASMFNEINEHSSPNGGITLIHLLVIGGVIYFIKNWIDGNKEEKKRNNTK